MKNLFILNGMDCNVNAHRHLNYPSYKCSRISFLEIYKENNLKIKEL